MCMFCVNDEKDKNYLTAELHYEVKRMMEILSKVQEKMARDGNHVRAHTLGMTIAALEFDMKVTLPDSKGRDEELVRKAMAMAEAADAVAH
jgi:hypothetical protein